MPKYNLYQLDLETYMEIVKLAQEHGKVAGDSMQAELEEILAKRSNIKLLGSTDMDKDLLKGNLREEGLKVFDPTEKRKDLE